jgi:hypothetical protein
MVILAPERDAFGLFIRLLVWNSIHAIVLATNARVNTFSMQPSQRYSRSWTPLTAKELLTLLSLLFYMANHMAKRRNEHWNSSQSVLNQWMGRTRWDQIHRFLTFSIEYIGQIPPLDAPWYARLEPVLLTVRRNCQTAIIPSSWVAVDEVMVSFSGRTKYIVKVLNKPIGIGYKIWALASEFGYIVDWLMHSSRDGVEAYSR